jgi:hypothetical protein
MNDVARRMHVHPFPLVLLPDWIAAEDRTMPK